MDLFRVVAEVFAITGLRTFFAEAEVAEALLPPGATGPLHTVRERHEAHARKQQHKIYISNTTKPP